MNQYGYALGNPVNGTDRSGLLLDSGFWCFQIVVHDHWTTVCVPTGGGGGGGTTGGGAGTGSNGEKGKGVCTGTCKDEEKPKDEVPPVVTPPKTPSKKCRWSGAGGSGGGSSFFEGLSNNASIFRDWVTESGQVERYYDGDTPQTADMRNTARMAEFRDDFAAKGFPAGFTTFGQPSFQAYGDTLRDPMNPTQFQVGAYSGMAHNPGTGVVNFHIKNTLSVRSFFGENALQQVLPHNPILPDNSRGEFPFMGGKMYQHFVWQERYQCE
jgi:hypothetical protein